MDEKHYQTICNQKIFHSILGIPEVKHEENSLNKSKARMNCSMPLARAVRSPPRTHVRPCFTAVAYASISSRANSQSQVLLGLSEKELQQLALDLNQVNLSSFPIQLHQNII